MKRYIYLILPQKIRGVRFYKELNNVLKTNKVKYFQLRLKKISTLNLIKISRKVKKITKKNNVKFLINDKPLVAKTIGADGCHIGQKDMDFINARKILGKNKIIGVTCHNSKKLALNAKKMVQIMWHLDHFLNLKQKKLLIKPTCRYCVGLKKKLICRPLR